MTRENQPPNLKIIDRATPNADPITGAGFPLAALIVSPRSAQDQEALAGHAAAMGFEVVAAGDRAIITSARLIEGEHKVQAIWMFLFLARHFELATHFSLVEADRFHFQMEKALRETATTLQQWVLRKTAPARGFVWLEGAISLHLHQSGFAVQPDAIQGLTLTQEQIKKFHEELLLEGQISDASRMLKSG